MQISVHKLHLRYFGHFNPKLTKVEVQKKVGGEYVGGEARVIDGHKCGPSGLRVPNSQQLDHLNKIDKTKKEQLKYF